MHPAGDATLPVPDTEDINDRKRRCKSSIANPKTRPMADDGTLRFLTSASERPHPLEAELQNGTNIGFFSEDSGIDCRHEKSEAFPGPRRLVEQRSSPNF